MSGKGSASVGSDEAAGILQLLQMQTQMQSMLIDGYSWAFKTCTSTSTGPMLSAKEKRCVQQAIGSYIDARSHVAQSMMNNKE